MDSVNNENISNDQYTDGKNSSENAENEKNHSDTDSLETHHRSSENINDYEVSTKPEENVPQREERIIRELVNNVYQNATSGKRPASVIYRNIQNKDRMNKSKSHDGNFRYCNSKDKSFGSKPSIETRVHIDDGKGVTTEAIFEHLPQECYPPPQNGYAKVVEFELADFDIEAQNKCTKFVEKVQEKTHGFFLQNKHKIKRAFCIIILILYAIYFLFAVNISPDGAVVLIAVTTMVVTYFLFREVWRRWGGVIYAKSCGPVATIFDKPWWKYCRWGIYGGILVAALAFLIFDVGRDGKRLTSAAGMVIFIFLAYITSTNPARVDWRPVLWGLGLQFLLGVLILRWSAGYYFFRFLGDQVKTFLDYTDEGSKFVFGDQFEMHRMAFKVFPTVIYFSAVISIFYYWGLMQFIVCKIAWVMQLTMGTTAIESLNAACNIFIGMAESCVLLRPFLHKLTNSELHAVMTGGFATVAGSYIALLVDVGAPPEHLLAAAIMSAPAALAMGKLSYPETQVSHTKTEDDVYMEKTPARNVVEAASNGAIAAIKVVASVAANLIAIMGLIAFLNATLSYLGARVGFPELSFQMLCSYVFWPLAAVMGVEMKDAGRVASLLGTKVFVDEYISFVDLGIMMEHQQLAVRSQVIATYACCGFGSIAAVGVYIGALVSVAPQRRGDISEVALRAVVNGNVAGFLTACIAGVLFTGDSLFFRDMIEASRNASLAMLSTESPVNSTLYVG